MPCLQTRLQAHAAPLPGGVLVIWPWDFLSRGPDKSCRSLQLRMTFYYSDMHHHVL